MPKKSKGSKLKKQVKEHVKEDIQTFKKEIKDDKKLLRKVRR